MLQVIPENIFDPYEFLMTYTLLFGYQFAICRKSKEEQ